MRKCTIPPASHCVHRYAAACCKDCSEKGCESRCQNDPSRCRCWTEGPPSKKRRERKIDARQAAWLYGRGLTQVEVAKRLGCGKSTVSTVLREAGVKRHG